MEQHECKSFDLAAISCRDCGRSWTNANGRWTPTDEIANQIRNAAIDECLDAVALTPADYRKLMELKQ